MLIEAGGSAAALEPSAVTWPGLRPMSRAGAQSHEHGGGAYAGAGRCVVKCSDDVMWPFLTAKYLVRCPTGRRTVRGKAVRSCDYL